jgi:hypothetical protein
MANKELRDLRIKAHSLFDPLWRGGGMTRKQAYRWLYDKTGKWIHMGEADEATCRLVIKTLEAK